MARLWALSGPVLQPGVSRGFSLGGPTLRHPRQRRALFTLGIETSCDDTCVSLLHTAKNGQFLNLYGEQRITCANKHHRGVHPVEAVESHTRNLPALVQTAFQGSCARYRPDLIAVTRGPGMKPCLSVGISFAKALSLAWGVPLVGVHHMQAHALSIQLDAEMQLRHGQSKDPGPQYPFLNLLYVSLHLTSLCDHTRLSPAPNGLQVSLEVAIIN